MTQISLNELRAFLNQYSNQLLDPVADYGGTDNIGEPIVKKMFLSVGIKKVKSLDLDSGYDLRKPIKGKFGTGICMDLLEHVTNPFLVAKNISNSLLPGAYLFVTAPWRWNYHDSAWFNSESDTKTETVWHDYWRFSPHGLIALFPNLEAIGSRIVQDETMGNGQENERTVAVFRKPLKRKK
ncbi:MAG: hypothetical protein Q7K40_01315 [bacterium]|nr:hypothetical protein [bacterium]